MDHEERTTSLIEKIILQGARRDLHLETDVIGFALDKGVIRVAKRLVDLTETQLCRVLHKIEQLPEVLPHD